MVNRVLPFVLLALAIALFVGVPALAEAEKNANNHEGTVVSFDGKKSDVSTFKTLKEGTKIRVWTSKDDATKVTKIEALDKNTDFNK